MRRRSALEVLSDSFWEAPWFKEETPSNEDFKKETPFKSPPDQFEDGSHFRAFNDVQPEREENLPVPFQKQDTPQMPSLHALPSKMDERMRQKNPTLLVSTAINGSALLAKTKPGTPYEPRRVILRYPGPLGLKFAFGNADEHPAIKDISISVPDAANNFCRGDLLIRVNDVDVMTLSREEMNDFLNRRPVTLTILRQPLSVSYSLWFPNRCLIPPSDYVGFPEFTHENLKMASHENSLRHTWSGPFHSMAPDHTKDAMSKTWTSDTLFSPRKPRRHLPWTDDVFSPRSEASNWTRTTQLPDDVHASPGPRMYRYPSNGTLHAISPASTSQVGSRRNTTIPHVSPDGDSKVDYFDAYDAFPPSPYFGTAAPGRLDFGLDAGSMSDIWDGQERERDTTDNESTVAEIAEWQLEYAKRQIIWSQGLPETRKQREFNVPQSVV